MDISDVSVVICTRNNKGNIRRVVKSVIDERPKEVIVVDGNSTDGTREILEKMNVNIITDPGQGLALARQIALNIVKGDYLFFVGDDNIIIKGTIAKLKRYMLDHDWVGVALQTRIHNCKSNYWAYCANWRWKVRFYEGEREVIGTPYMFQTELLRQIGYDSDCKYSDDTDMEKRLSELTGRKMGYSNMYCYEIGKTGYKETVARFLMYGKGDYEFWRKYSNGWGFKRKIKSILHPIQDELIKPLRSIKLFSVKFCSFPYFVFITVLRYVGWIKEYYRMR